jgi:protoporphyrinogen oxidase
MPLTLLASRIPNIPERVIAATRALTFRNTILVYLQVDAPALFRDQWLYIHTPGIATGRISNFRNWVPALYGVAGTTILTLESWCNDGDAIWSAPDAELIAIAKRELATTGLAGTASILEGKVIRVARCYPVYRRGYRDHFAIVVDYLRGIRGLQIIGRYGAFKYNNQDHSISMGLLAAANVSVNTDDECGLVPR